MKNTLTSLNSKWWYRLLKLVWPLIATVFIWVALNDLSPGIAVVTILVVIIGIPCAFYYMALGTLWPKTMDRDRTKVEGMSFSALNTKWWHRLFKVTFVATYVFLLIFAELAVLGDSYPENAIDLTATTIVCNAGNKQTISFKSVPGLDTGADYLPQGPEFSDLVYPHRPDIRKACGTSAEEARKYDEEFEESLKPGAPDATKFDYDIIPATTEKYLLHKITVFGLLVNAGLIVVLSLIFIGIQRTYYYVVLGTFKPVKK